MSAPPFAINRESQTAKSVFDALDPNMDGPVDARELLLTFAATSTDPLADEVTANTLTLLASSDKNGTEPILSFADFIKRLDVRSIDLVPSDDFTIVPHTRQQLLTQYVNGGDAEPITSSSSGTAPSNPILEAAPGLLTLEFWKQKINADTLKHLAAGGVAGAVSRTVVSPLERMKILFQIQGPEQAYKGIIPTLAKMWREEGLMGFLRGNGTNVVRIIPYSATQFASYEQFKIMLMEPGKTELDTPRRLTAGALAGLTSVACTYPLDIVRTRLAVQSATIPGNFAGKIKLPGIWGTTKNIYKNEGGIRGLYSGLWPTLLGIAPYVALNFQFYEIIKKYLTPPDQKQPSVVRKLACGALAGSIAQTITYPLDVLRRRMQVTGMASMNYKYKGTWDAATTMIKKEGVRGLYRGMIPNYLKVAPAISVSFVTYEWCKDLLHAK